MPFTRGAWWILFLVIPVWLNQRNSTIELSSYFQPEIRQGRVAGKSFKKIRYRLDCLLIRAILMVKKYMHENLRHISTKTFGQKKSMHTIRQLLPTIANMFQISCQTILTLWWSYFQTILHTFPGIKQCWIIKQNLLAPHYHGKWEYRDRLPVSCYGRGPKVRNGRKYNWNHFFVWDSNPLFFIYTGNFQVSPEKNHPTQNPNLT